MTLFLTPRLGLTETRLAHADRHGLLMVSKAQIIVVAGTLVAKTADEDTGPGQYHIPYQGLSMLLMGPGCSITHDSLRILARHGVAVVGVGEGGVKCYSAPPWGPSRSALARQHATLWADASKRLTVAKRMYAKRFGRIFPHRDLNVLRGMEGARVKESYQVLADKYGIAWQGRRYDRDKPSSADVPNQAINHFATFVESAAEIATYATGAMPPLGFIPEDAHHSFVLDIADLYRVEVVVPLAFQVAKSIQDEPAKVFELERICRMVAAKEFRSRKLIPRMIDDIKQLLEAV